MAGRRQHHIPRFLQKGFLSKEKKKQLYTFVFTREKAPYQTNLLNIGLEIDFYGNPLEPEADNNITSDETEYAEFVEFLREKKDNSIIDPLKCALFISHMYIRSKSARESMNEIGEALFTSTKEKLNSINNPEILTRHLIKTQRKEVAKQLKKSLPDHLTDEQKFSLTKYLLDNPNKWFSKLDPNIWKQFLISFGIVAQNFPQLVKNSHNKTLEKKTFAKGIVEKTESFHWELLNYSDHSFILGDIAG
jgi:hypothetical protein